MLSNILVVIICHYATGAKFKEEVLTHTKHRSMPYIYLDTYPSIFLDRIQTFSIKKIFLNGLYIC